MTRRRSGEPAAAANGNAKAPNGAAAPALAAIRAAIVDAQPVEPEADTPFGFIMRPGGLFRSTREGGEFYVSSHFEVVAESRPERQDDWGLLLRWRDRDGQQHEWIMPRRLLAGDAVEVRAKLIACGVTVSARDDARRALVEFLTNVRTPARVRTVQRVGWHRPPSGTPVFVLPDRMIGELRGETVVLDVEPRPRVFRRTGTLDGWRESVAGPSACNSRLVFAIACAFAAPLLGLLGDEGGGVHLRGGSSRGKTTAVDLAASVWGAPSKSGPDSFVRPWRTTDTALEATAATHNHVLLPMDEIGEADPARLGALAYMLANGSGRERARASGGNRVATTWLTIVLSTGEESIAAVIEAAGRRVKAGGEVRMLEVPAEVEGGHGVFEELHGASDGAAFQARLRRGALAQHGTAGPAFVEWLVGRLAEDGDYAASVIAPRVADAVRTLVDPAADGQVQRGARRIALIAVAGELATEAGVTGWGRTESMDAAMRVFDAWVADRGGTGSREDMHVAAAFRRFIALHGPSRFVPLGDGYADADGARQEPKSAFGDRTMQRAGWRWQENQSDGAKVIVHGMLPDVFDAEIARPLGLEGRDARARLGRAGLIRAEHAGGEKRWAVRVANIPGVGRPRLIIAEPSAMCDTGG